MDRLAELRERRALTLRELAEMSGVAADTINQIELGHRKARPSTLRRLARALGVDVIAFFEEPVLSGKAKAPESGPTEEQRRFDEAPALPEVQDWVRGLGPEAALLAMDDDEFYGHAESVIRDVFDLGSLISKLAGGRDAVEDALKASTLDMPGMPDILHAASDKGKSKEEQLHANFRRRRADVGRWARSRALVRSLNLMESARQYISDEVEKIETPEAETVEKKA